MKDKELKSIYRYTSENRTYHVDIQLDEYRDVYSEWDYSPFTNRDLDEDLLEYLMSCSYEIPTKTKYSIDFFLLNKACDIKREERSIEGIRHYFEYKIRQTRVARLALMRSTLSFFVIGSLMLFIHILIDQYFVESIFRKIVSEGLFIGAWVAIWEIFSIWFFQINGFSSKMKHYRRLQTTPIVYHYERN